MAIQGMCYCAVGGGIGWVYVNSDNEGIEAWDDMRWRDAALQGVAYSTTSYGAAWYDIMH